MKLELSDDDRLWFEKIYLAIDDIGLSWESLYVVLEMAFKRGYDRGVGGQEERIG